LFDQQPFADERVDVDVERTVLADERHLQAAAGDVILVVRALQIRAADRERTVVITAFELTSRQ
jgi:hypothetical protein